MDDQRLKQLLSEAKTIAVVGVSDNPNKTANQIAEYLLRVGYTVIPVNPMLEEWNGRKAYPSVESIPGRIDIVDVFRRSEFLAGVAEDAVRHGDVGLVFNQLGLSSAEAEQIVRDAGLDYIENRCLYVEHARLLG
ncbi:CoA-binding protein [Exiguobacterium profundum]|uniref:CoA-binding protein n=1 Tax=Exiguobacterium profundum TaxID=307643 RepID=A0ABY8B6A0_9BACL|nr:MULTISPECIES: CoA-binding protein [Exiguobacterium]MBG0917046.1 CoA-binding protein [Exiguobacterium sp. SRB7LM]MBQ6458009.1 CoA-binding protein [Exiguobacterium sp.]MBR2757305.1 CoA-binding protein [Exiguobacterium sp.]MCM3280268.1 CoA-binding protein [Exiguobacterium sp. MER 193]MCT4798215.1 CoA-binding protein [Exiguobacterium profundum]